MKNAIALSVVLLTSCATIVDPGPDETFVTSDPLGAQVLFGGKLVGVTPCVVRMPRRMLMSVDWICIQKKGYEIETPASGRVRPSQYARPPSFRVQFEACELSTSTAS